MANSSSLTGKAVIVTGTHLQFLQLTFPNSKHQLTTETPSGGASGIGLALVRYFASHCSRIAILDISTPPSSVLSTLQTDFPISTFLFQKCDISSWDEQAAIFKTVYEEYGSVDVVCANAGVSEIGTFLESEEDGDEPRKPELKTLDINLVGTLFCELISYHPHFSKSCLVLV